MVAAIYTLGSVSCRLLASSVSLFSAFLSSALSCSTSSVVETGFPSTLCSIGKLVGGTARPSVHRRSHYHAGRTQPASLCGQAFHWSALAHARREEAVANSLVSSFCCAPLDSVAHLVFSLPLRLSLPLCQHCWECKPLR